MKLNIDKYADVLKKYINLNNSMMNKVKAKRELCTQSVGK